MTAERENPQNRGKPNGTTELKQCNKQSGVLELHQVAYVNSCSVVNIKSKHEKSSEVTQKHLTAQGSNRVTHEPQRGIITSKE